MEENQSFPLETYDPSPSEPTPQKHESVVSMVLEYMEIVVFSICAILLIFHLVGRLCRVNGESMCETLQHNQLLITTSIGQIDRGDIVVFHQTTNGEEGQFNEPLVKRVIAKGGDTIRIDYVTGQVFVNGQEISEPYVTLKNPDGYYNPYRYPDYGYNPLTGVFEATVPEGCYFVLGDNRNHSADSRYAEIGFVDGRRMLGRVLFRVKPFTIFN